MATKSLSIRIEEEMLDRFGEAPAAVDNLLDIAHLRFLARKLGIAQVTWRKDCLNMRFDDHYAPDPMKLLQGMMQTDSRLGLAATKPAALQLKDGRLEQEQMLREGVKVLEKLIDNMEKPAE